MQIFLEFASQVAHHFFTDVERDRGSIPSDSCKNSEAAVMAKALTVPRCVLFN